MKPRKHAELIKAWADDDEMEIQVRRGTSGWMDAMTPSWSVGCEYRIKPKKVKKWAWAFKRQSDTHWKITAVHYSEEEFRRNYPDVKSQRIEASLIEVEE